MAKTLFLFNGVTPNIEGHEFFNIKNFANYLSYLQAHYSYETISDDNYRINSNIVKISTENLTNKLFTYAIETDGNGWHRCFYVDAITEQSSMLYLQLSIDYWGTYYLESNIEYLHVTRCNRNVGIGVYDDIKIAGTELQQNDFKQIYFGGVAYPSQPTGPKNYITNLYQVCLCFSLSYVFRRTGVGSKEVFNTATYAISLQDLIDKYYNKYGASYFNNITLFELIDDFIGGINGVENAWWGSNDALVNKAWLIPTDLISTSGFNFSPVVVVKSKWSTDAIDNTLKIDVWSIGYGHNEETYTLHEEDYDLNYDLFIGTRYGQGLKLARLTSNELKFTYCCDVSQSDIAIYVKQGANQFDITKHFVVEIVKSTDEDTPLRSIAKFGSQVGNALINTTRAYTKFGAFGVGVTAVNTIASLINGFDVGKEVKGEGDIYTTYNFSISRASRPTYNLVGTPYCINMYKSSQNEKEHARFYGAQFDVTIDGISEILQNELLGESDYDLTYIVADDIRLNNLPSIARQEIENAFKNGVELLDYEGTASE